MSKDKTITDDDGVTYRQVPALHDWPCRGCAFYDRKCSAPDLTGVLCMENETIWEPVTE